MLEKQSRLALRSNAQLFTKKKSNSQKHSNLKPSGVIHFLIQSNNTRNVVFSEVGKISFRRVKWITLNAIILIELLKKNVNQNSKNTSKNFFRQV